MANEEHTARTSRPWGKLLVLSVGFAIVLFIHSPTTLLEFGALGVAWVCGIVLMQLWHWRITGGMLQGDSNGK